MPPPIGTTLGAYEITVPLGAGGMGEVYRARDTKLGRDVAIKILPDVFAADPERIARFQREAQILASLNHPHIAAIYGLEEAPSTAPTGSGQVGSGPAVRFLVLEFVDGESLAARIEGLGAKGLGLEESLRLARQMIDALEAAHDKGIVHRDLKPGNIMVTRDGVVKVLDFGLAKQDDRSASLSGERGEMTHSPTLTFAATQAGMILGTAAYMSPEQARSRAADKRSDVWAFGCVLYEMLTGTRAFDGEDATEIIAAVVKTEPDWNAFPADVPTHIRSIIKRCLAKDRKARVPDLSVVRFMLDETAPTPSPTAVEAGSERTRPTDVLRAWQAATALLLLTTIAVPVTYLLRAHPLVVTRFFVSPPEHTTFVAGLRQTAVEPAISPDGNTLAFTARDAAGRVLLWVRPIDSLTAQPLVGTDNAAYPFWSPDSRSIAYSTPGKLMKIAAGGGPPQTLCAFSGASILGRGGAWNRDGVIVFNNGPGPLFRVSSAGGQPSPVGHLAPGQASYNFPSFLPDAHHVLVYAVATQEASGLYATSLDTGESKKLLDADSGGIYSPQGGYLLFVRQGTLLAQPFDPKTLALASEPFPVAEHVESGSFPGIVAFSLSSNGALAYGAGSAAAVGIQMVWLDRQGKPLETVGPPGNYRGIDLSPDGKRVAAHRHDGNGGDIWISELSRGTTSRFTFDAAQDNASPVWSPDGSRIVYGSVRNGKSGLYQKLSNGTGVEEKLLESDAVSLPVSWSPDGRSIVYTVVDPKTQSDQWILPLSGDRKPAPLLHSVFTEVNGQISPDGKWLAYSSNETSRGEVYVQPFPQGTGKWQVSTGGGVFPHWRRDGRELFYMDQLSRGKMLAVEVKSSGAGFEAGTPRELFDSGYTNFPHIPYLTYAVSPDGQRFLIPRPASTDQQTAAMPIVVVLNWLESLKK